jgi:pyrimidine-nucleoside phosphorylase
MVSGRGLGHTGGTLDKLESIPGFRTDLSYDEFRRQLRDIGVAMGAQTADLVPADRRLYELRSLTATVPQTGLITASILSKKIAEGAEGLVLDVKTGSGAFMQRLEDAHKLADRLHHVAGLAGLKCSVLITDMDQPLGCTVGNALEVRESIEILQRSAEHSADLEELTLELTAEMIVLGGLADDHDAAKAAATRALEDGAALERLRLIIERQGGDAGVVDDPSRLPQAASSRPVVAPAQGFIERLDARLIGDAALALGAGRTRRSDALDPGAGIELHAKRGDHVDRDEPWATLYHGAGADLERALQKLEAALTIGSDQPAEVPLLKERRS